VLNGEGRGPINNLVVPSDVAPGYAPDGQSLVSVSVLDPAATEEAVRDQLVDWFGEGVRHWRLLKHYRLPHALPSQPPPALSPPQRPSRVAPGLYVCGDPRANASIQGAMASGRQAADAVLGDAA